MEKAPQSFVAQHFFLRDPSTSIVGVPCRPRGLLTRSARHLQSLKCTTRLGKLVECPAPFYPEVWLHCRAYIVWAISYPCPHTSFWRRLLAATCGCFVIEKHGPGPNCVVCVLGAALNFVPRQCCPQIFAIVDARRDDLITALSGIGRVAPWPQAPAG